MSCARAEGEGDASVPRRVGMAQRERRVLPDWEEGCWGELVIVRGYTQGSGTRVGSAWCVEMLLVWDEGSEGG